MAGAMNFCTLRPRGVYLDHLDELKELMKEGVGESKR
jgi:hypothetical protein